MTIEVYQKGETVPCWAEDLNWEGVYIDPSQGIKITIYYPDGTKAVDNQAMSKIVTGDVIQFVYYYASKSDDPGGEFSYECTATDGTSPNERIVISEGSFTLE
jgi:hypothetical protein